MSENKGTKIVLSLKLMHYFTISYVSNAIDHFFLLIVYFYYIKCYILYLYQIYDFALFLYY
jgi:hypothetical protein